jgi:hypothetical protein
MVGEPVGKLISPLSSIVVFTGIMIIYVTMMCVWRKRCFSAVAVVV